MAPSAGPVAGPVAPSASPVAAAGPIAPSAGPFAAAGPVAAAPEAAPKLSDADQFAAATNELVKPKEGAQI